MSNDENKFQPIFQILHIKSACFLLELAMALVTTIGMRFLQVWLVWNKKKGKKIFFTFSLFLLKNDTIKTSLNENQVWSHQISLWRLVYTLKYGFCNKVISERWNSTTFTTYLSSLLGVIATVFSIRPKEKTNML